MSIKILIIFGIAAFLRLFALFISNKNERQLKLAGATEYGEYNTTALVIVHTLFYFFCFVEAYIRETQFDTITIFGLALYAFSMIILYTVIYQLRDIWTIKLIIAKDHMLNNSFIFKYFRHPNYFLNVIPELLAMGLIFKPWITLIVLFPIYMIFLSKRIIQENLVMKQTFTNY